MEPNDEIDELIKRYERIIEDSGEDEAENPSGSSPLPPNSPPKEEEETKSERILLHPKLSDIFALSLEASQDNNARISVEARETEEETILNERGSPHTARETGPFSYYMALVHHEEFIIRELESMTTENRGIDNTCQSIINDVQVLQRKIRELLADSELEKRREREVRRILGKKKTKLSKVDNFIQRGRRKSTTFQRAGRWEKRLLQLKGLTTDLKNEQTSIISQIEQSLEDLESVEKNSGNDNVIQKLIERRHSDGVLANRKESSSVMDRMNTEDRRQVFAFNCKILARKARKLRKAGMKMKFDILFEFNRTRTCITREIFDVKKKSSSRYLEYSDHQFELLERFGVWDYLHNSRSIEKEGWIFLKKKTKSKFFSLRETWIRVYLELSFLHTSMSLYSDGESKRNLISRWSLENVVLKEGTGLKDFALDLGYARLCFKGNSRKETGEWFVFFQVMRRKDDPFGK